MIFATKEDTAALAARFPAYQQFYRAAQGLTVSSLGIGSYLGLMDDATDAGYREALSAAVESGINFIDTSLNYRHQRSEIAIGFAIEKLRRQELILCTKAGYLVPHAVPKKLEEVVGRMHTIEPVFLEDQLRRSRDNLRVDAVDVFYLHNPETQLQYVSEDEFYSRMERAFLKCEELAAAGKIQFYGTATWNGYRVAGPVRMSLTRLAAIAERVGGPRHRFRFVQLPFNLAMREAYTLEAEPVNGERASVLEAARRLGITVVASASLLQGEVLAHVPDSLSRLSPRLNGSAALAIQFARSAPGITTALVGMSRSEHVRQNLAVAAEPPLSAAQFSALLA